MGYRKIMKIKKVLKALLPYGIVHLYKHGLGSSFVKRASPKTLFDKTEKSELLIWTTANEKYYEFAILFPLFAAISNPDAVIEIGVENFDKFKNKYGHLILYYQEHYKNRVLFSEIKQKNIVPNSLRFLIQPNLTAKYIYIGDIDILMTDEILQPHLKNINDNNLDFSNIKRKGLLNLSGLHFIEYEKMFPILLDSNIDLNRKNDEELLYILMQNKGLKIPCENTDVFRPLMGIHASYYSRPSLPFLTTNDKLRAKIPSWFCNVSEQGDVIVDISYAEKFMKIRYEKEAISFMSHIEETDIDLRRIIQFIDISCDYILKRWS
jgi:hypothetical protein